MTEREKEENQKIGSLQARIERKARRHARRGSN